MFQQRIMITIVTKCLMICLTTCSAQVQSAEGEKKIQLSEQERKALTVELNNALKGNPDSPDYFKNIERLLNKGADPQYSKINDLKIPETIMKVVNFKSRQFVKSLFDLLEQHNFKFNDPQPGKSAILIELAARSGKKYNMIKTKTDYFNAILDILTRESNPIMTADEYGKTFLHYLANNNVFNKQQNAQLVAIAIQRGADINSQTRSGATPLYFAASSADIVFGNILMHHNANPFIVDDENITPLDALNRHIKHLQEEAQRPFESYEDPELNKRYMPTHKAAQKQLETELREANKFKADLTSYMRTYKEKHAKAISAGTPLPLPVSGVVAEYLFGEQPRRAESSAAPTVPQEGQLQEVD